MSDKVKDVLNRALKTFWQTSAAYIIAEFTILSAAVEGTDTWVNVLITLGIGAVAAGLSAVWNAIFKPLLTSEETEEAVEDALEDSTIATILESWGIDLADITKDGLEKIADTVGAVLESDDLKDDIIAKIYAALGIETTAETAEESTT